jgi:two-component system sporulation sensor kinase B
MTQELAPLLLNLLVDWSGLMVLFLAWPETARRPDRTGIVRLVALIGVSAVWMAVLLPSGPWPGYHVTYDILPWALAMLYGATVSGLITAVAAMVGCLVIPHPGEIWILVGLTAVVLPVLTPLRRRWEEGAVRTKMFIAVALTASASLITLFTLRLVVGPSAHDLSLGVVAATEVAAAGLAVSFIEAMLRTRRLYADLIQANMLRMAVGLSASMAHEVRNPLTIARGTLELLQGDGMADGRVATAVAEIDRAESLLSRYLELHRTQSETWMPVEATAEVLYASQVLEPLAKRAGVTIATQTAGLETWVFQPAYALRQALLNLGKNAIEAMADRGGVLTYTVAADAPRRVVIIVEDTGHGMSPAQVDRFPHPVASTKPEGAGLGLAITYDLVRQMHGSMSLQSEPGVGTVFTIRLPCSIGHLAPEKGLGTDPLGRR